jgi:NDP-sugar pyrophosphorylase family protein
MKAVILAGGTGTRLAPYTKILPKPLMPIGDMPILEVLLRQLSNAGVEEVILTVGYLAELLRAFFSDGSRLGMKVRYSYEDKPLGTAGPLSLIADQLQEPFIVTNGDVLTTLDIRAFVADHRRSGAIATIATHARQVTVDLGVLQFNDDYDLTGYIEKPVYDYFVSMGIYVFEPRVLEYIPYNQRLDFPDLVLNMIEAGERVHGYLFDGYWQDLGRRDDYEQATSEFDAIRAQILGEG